MEFKPPEPEPVAQPAPTPVAPVTVQARLSPAELSKAAYAFVQAYAAPTIKIDHIARWREPICVHVDGVTALEARRLQARVEDVARALGRPLAKPGCAPNIDIKVTSDPQGVLDRIAARAEATLGYYHRSNTAGLKRVTRPIQAWYMTATVGGGAPNAGALFANVGRSRPEADNIDDPDSPTPNGCGDSRLSGSCLRSVFNNVLIVVDSGRVGERTPGAVSDYVAMLALSQPRSLDGCGILPSVIDAFARCDVRPAPEGLTPADVAYLMSLYETDAEASLSTARFNIAARMTRLLSSADAAARLVIATATSPDANQR
ncbi:MAG: hypothetical protein ACXU8Q_08015 [Caulobacteraceae bacterium]